MVTQGVRGNCKPAYVKHQPDGMPEPLNANERFAGPGGCCGAIYSGDGTNEKGQFIQIVWCLCGCIQMQFSQHEMESLTKLERRKKGTDNIDKQFGK
jgi:hypothetical protein